MLEATNKETYSYDGHGRRVKILRTSDGKASFPFYSQDGKLITENDHRLATATTFDYVYLNGSLVAKRTNAIGSGTYSTRNYFTDALGSPVAESNSSAAVTRLENFTPYGEVTDAVYDQGPGFTGHVTDAATGLSYMQQRYYDPMLGRFLSIDPISTSHNLGGNFNRYWYASDNPFRFVDPDGRAPIFAMPQPLPRNAEELIPAKLPELKGPGLKSAEDGKASAETTKTGAGFLRPTGHEYRAGRQGHPLVKPGGLIGKVIDDAIPGGHTFAVNHDKFVDKAVEAGVPDQIANIPSMPLIFQASVLQEAVNAPVTATNVVFGTKISAPLEHTDP